MDEPDIYSLFMGEGPTAQQQAAALAAALRQRRAEEGANRGLATVTALGENPLLSGLNQTAMQNANALGQGVEQREQMLAQAGGHQAQRQMQQQEHVLQRAMQAERLGLESQRLDEERRYHNAETYLRRQAMEYGKYSQGPMGIINTRTGELVTGPTGAGGLPALGTKANSQLNTMSDALGKAVGLDSELNKPLQERRQAGERIKAIAYDPVTGKMKPIFTAQDMTEMAASGAAMLAGGHPPESLVHQLIPNTAGMDWAQMVQRFTNNPQDAGAKAFVQLWVDQQRREDTVLARQMLRNQLRGAGKHQRFINQYPDVAWPILKSQGITKEMFGEDGLPLPEYLQDAAEPRTEGKTPVGTGGGPQAMTPQTVPVSGLDLTKSPTTAKAVTGYRYNKDRTKRVPVFADGTQGAPEPANG